MSKSTLSLSADFGSNRNRGRSKFNFSLPSLQFFLWAGILTLVGVTIMYGTEVLTLLSSLEIKGTISSERVIRERDDSRLQISQSTLIILTSGKGIDLKIEQVYVIVNNKEQGDQWAIHFPGELYIQATFTDFAEYISISNLHYLGELVRPEIGKEYTIWELGQLLGYKFNNYIWLDSTATEIIYSGFQADTNEGALALSNLIGSASPVNLVFHSGEVEALANGTDSNLNIREIITLMNQSRPILSSDGKFFDLRLPQHQTFAVTQLGAEIVTVTPQTVDAILRDIGVSSRNLGLESEQAKVEVYNGSEVVGLASKYTRQLKNNSVNVIRFNNGDLTDQTRIYTSDPEKYRMTIESIQQLLPFRVVVVHSRPQFLTTGDVILHLGSDLELDSAWLLDLVQ